MGRRTRRVCGGAAIAIVVCAGCNALSGVDGLEIGDGDADVPPPGAEAGPPSRLDASGDAPAGEDAKAAPNDGGDAARDAGREAAGPLRVFVTDRELTAAFGGTAGGDLACQQSADAASLGGQWRAWLSTTNESAIARITSAGPWQLTNGVTAVTRAGGTLSLSAPIRRNENGVNVPLGRKVWTGTTASGTVIPTDTCDGWTSVDGTKKGAQGSANTTSPSWTAESARDCDQLASLYCFEL